MPVMENEEPISSLKKKIDDLNKEAWALRVLDSEKAFALSQESVSLSRRINYTKGLAEGTVMLGFCHVRRSENEPALALLNESLSLFEELDDLNGQSEALEYIAIIQRNWGNFGESLRLLFKALALTEQTGFKEKTATNHYQLGVTYKYLGDFEKALEHLYKSLSITKKLEHALFQSYSINIIGSIYFDSGDYEKALEYYKQGLVARQKSGDKWGEAGSLDNIGFTYLKLKKHREAIEYCEKSLSISKSTDDKRGQANALIHLAEIYRETGDNTNAIKFSNESLELRKASGDKRGVAQILLFLAETSRHDQQRHDKETLRHLTDVLTIADEIKAPDLQSLARKGLYLYYKAAGDFKEAISQLEQYNDLEVLLHKNAIAQKVANLDITYKAEETKKEAEAIRLKNEELIRLNKEIVEQKNKLETALQELKAAQAQLIQSEKMASLGELTAGIAHEIQNPLNFVNNFSDINQELADELEQETDKGNLEEVKAIIKDIKENEKKINHHGRRADAIVKGMLQHSRISSGVKEPTDINALCDEYLRLAYHGLRAKDKSFNVAINTDLDNKIGKINIVPQDIGRAILNLINNAFYAVAERSKEQIPGYDPTVTVSTKKSEDKIEIKVKDNGTGIPDAVKEKIFQPFFTTKPTGQGTGLGLSLSYDIIKAHGGEIKVNSKAGEGTEFIIQLPVV